jgi:hypothetical protein
LIPVKNVSVLVGIPQGSVFGLIRVTSSAEGVGIDLVLRALDIDVDIEGARFDLFILGIQNDMPIFGCDPVGKPAYFFSLRG